MTLPTREDVGPKWTFLASSYISRIEYLATAPNTWSGKPRLQADVRLRASKPLVTVWVAEVHAIAFDVSHDGARLKLGEKVCTAWEDAVAWSDAQLEKNFSEYDAKVRLGWRP